MKLVPESQTVSRIRAFGLMLLLISCFALLAAAQSPAASHAKVELIAEQNTAPAGQPLWVGVLFRLDPGWHIYWQNPGDSGQPPKVEWQLPQGFTAGSILWPVPIRLATGTIVDCGYEGQVLLMVPLSTQSKQSTMLPNASANLKYIVCREICIPGKAHLTLAPPSNGDNQQLLSLFRQTRQELPKPMPRSWKLAAESNKSQVILTVWGGSRISKASFFPMEPDQIDNSSSQAFASNRAGFQLTLKKSDQLIKPISILKGLIVVGAGQAFEVAASVILR
jgi:DsbC/DsbD-like thiol-disulfide interchange protein